MYCRSRRLVQETASIKKYLADFLYERLDTKTITDYDVIKNHFTNFKIDREFDNFLTDQGDYSLTFLRFSLCRNVNGDPGEEEWIYFLSITIETDPVTAPTYIYNFNESLDVFNEFLIDNPDLENFRIDIEMETIFNLNLNVVVISDSDTDDEIDNNVSVEKIFAEDICSVCLENKTNILFLPCTHFVVCEKCEDKGKFINCIKCREKIYRKLRIEITKKYVEKKYVEKSVGNDEKKYVEKCVGNDEKKYVEKCLGTNDYEKIKKQKPKNIDEQIKILEEKLEKVELKNQFLEILLDYGKEKEELYEYNLYQLKNNEEISKEKIKKRKLHSPFDSDKLIEEENKIIKNFLRKLLYEE